MKKNKKDFKVVTARLLTVPLLLVGLVGCSFREPVSLSAIQNAPKKIMEKPLAYTRDFEFVVDPGTFALSVNVDGEELQVSAPQSKIDFADFKKTNNSASWRYPKQGLTVSIKKSDGALSVHVLGDGKDAKTVSWPSVQGDSYILPLGEGKRFESTDSNWKTYLEEMELDLTDGYSMPFFGTMNQKHGIMYILDDPYNSTVKFTTKSKIGMLYSHRYTTIDKDRDYGYKIYITDTNPVTMSKLYRQERMAQGKFTTLEEKAASQPNIRKLYGAPHIYLWEKNMPVSFLKDLKKAGIEKAWLGFDTWAKGTENPSFVKEAVQKGYLIGMYDSYHSIHANGAADWETAKFSNPALYEEATVTKANGKKATGFGGKGRKLNPRFSMPEVKARLDRLVTPNLPFNSWFIDCDATGEALEDYTKGHETTISQDLTARLERMAYIRDQKNLVIGSEGGNDFASQTIAFAHGIEMPAFSWMDQDMSKNKNSPYYLGKYYDYRGGVAEVFRKPVPLKSLYEEIFLNPYYDVPLFKLVYNDSVITTYQWSWDTFKMKDFVEQRMLKEVLYNIPPMYHLDTRLWKQRSAQIMKHQKIWGPFHEKAVKMEMTDFQCLNAERTVQMTTFGDSLSVICNYTKKPFIYKGKTVQPMETLILNH